ncbi:hypothetical protein ACFYXM_29385 [Streptomyces sp. NPDC002476]|uniref:hypothetical protein n=1 Tax=Streptomyces sp. NPDC002476 TaxID=3364648 RepID=UPI00367D79E0
MTGRTGKADGSGTVRLLPWARPDGRPCYVVGDGTGYVSRMADRVESIQLGMADDLLGHADDLLAERRVTGGELHYLASRLAESLRDVKRVAESRGARLAQVTGQGPEAHVPERR